jgi:hypothetical protein
MTTPHKYADVIKAWADGKQIQFKEFDWKDWKDWYPHYEYQEYENPTGYAPSFNPRYWEYRVKPEPHRWQEVIDAYNSGKEIQYRTGYAWFDHPNKSESLAPRWDTSHIEYRIKPVVNVVDVHIDLNSYSLLITKDPNVRLSYLEGKLVDAEVIKYE